MSYIIMPDSSSKISKWFDLRVAILAKWFFPEHYIHVHHMVGHSAAEVYCWHLHSLSVLSLKGYH